MKLIIKPIVEKWLIKEPALRDSDERLCAAIWRNEIERQAAPTLFPDFLAYYAAGKLTSAESIRRTRQKLQEEQPALRGAKYEARQAAQQKAKQELGY